jgi:NarL family two-component system sensor histidine kinase LiaS
MSLLLASLIFMLQAVPSMKGPASLEDSEYMKRLDEINESIELGQRNNDLYALAQGYYERAKCSFETPLRSQDVIGDLIESAKIYKYLKDDLGFYNTRMALAEFYVHEEIYLNEALKLTDEALQYFSSKGLNNFTVRAITQLGKIHEKKLNYEEAIAHIEKGLAMSMELGDHEVELENRLLMIELFGKLGNVEQVIEQGEYAIKVEDSYGIDKITPAVNFAIGNNLALDGQVDLAIAYLEKARELQSERNELMFEIYELLANLYHQKEEYNELAFEYLQEARTLSSELFNQEKYALVNQMAVKYQTYEKERAIRDLEQENDLNEFKLAQRTRLFVILIVLFVLTAASVFNYYRLQKHKLETESLISKQREEISKQKINDLENSLKIKNLEAVVNGQEAERTRIATDLHDSLGGMLSTLKLQYDSLQEDHEELAEDSAYHRINQMIDEACTDVRDIARNLKPTSLGKLGLTAALRDLVNRFSNSGSMEISLRAEGIDNLLDEEGRLHVYRIIQELLNNALKHAQASEIDVQLNRQDSQLIVMVEDNGRGFVEEEIERGLGLENLHSRVNVLRGEIDIDSAPSKGTAVIVHIPLNQESLVPSDT